MFYKWIVNKGLVQVVQMLFCFYRHKKYRIRILRIREQKLQAIKGYKNERIFNILKLNDEYLVLEELIDDNHKNNLELTNAIDFDELKQQSSLVNDLSLISQCFAFNTFPDTNASIDDSLSDSKAFYWSYCFEGRLYIAIGFIQFEQYGAIFIKLIKQLIKGLISEKLLTPEQINSELQIVLSRLFPSYKSSNSKEVFLAVYAYDSLGQTLFCPANTYSVICNNQQDVIECDCLPAGEMGVVLNNGDLVYLVLDLKMRNAEFSTERKQKLLELLSDVSKNEFGEQEQVLTDKYEVWEPNRDNYIRLNSGYCLIVGLSF